MCNLGIDNNSSSLLGLFWGFLSTNKCETYVEPGMEVLYKY